MKNTDIKQQKRVRRHGRIRAKIAGTQERPRLCVFRSNRALYVQVIDDVNGKTMCALDTRKVAGATLGERALALGKELAAVAQKNGVVKVVFDRGGFVFTGSIKQFAEGARAGGLQF